MPTETDAFTGSEHARIDLTRDVDVAFWCRLLDVDHSQLRRAIQQVGPRSDAVMRYLKRSLPAAVPPQASEGADAR
ncbi:DUF3606 domain-containing protein [Piscinibacter terrae]|uniref:DUF3606 domain-containing protein n=1 Tax=Piscinibacter terrae TaxID=2496871 RepID=A0A3N7ITS4_9BURK|nr:DUF3606 domain-containing protein [Albitalea terrae]RQP22242.1 DUF3606 domain-containing protein [Albitalea terrae]